MAQPFLVALAVTMVWRDFWKMGIWFNAEDQETIVSGFLPVLGIAYGVLITEVLRSVWGKYKKVVEYVKEKNRREFLELRDEKMPIVLHLLVGSISVPLMGMIFMLHFKNEWIGFASIFAVAFILFFYWVVLAQLENPVKSAWLAERIPEEWLTADVDEAMGLENETKESAPENAETKTEPLG